jgi:ubiquinone/menaquinone biosynthesis C-methylase UbiE
MVEANNLGNIFEEIQKSYIEGRDLNYYRKVFGYTEKTLMGKTLLDAGSGYCVFAKEASEFGAKVISLDGRPSNFKNRHVDNGVVGIMQKLPFKDESFDEVVASHSVCYVNTGLQEALSEMIRVTKPNGKIRIHPVSLIDNLPYNPYFYIEQCSQNDLLYYDNLIINKIPNLSAKDWKLIVNEALPYLYFKYWSRH